MQPLTMKTLIINCLAIYGGYRLVKDFVEDNCGVEIIVRQRESDRFTKMNDISNADQPRKKGWSFTVSR